MNPLSDTLVTGTTGELLFQLRLLQFGVQAAPPLRDSGNDLIAIKGDTLRAIQIKTTTGDTPRLEKPRRNFHFLGLACLVGDGDVLHADECRLYLIPKDDVDVIKKGEQRLADYALTRELVERVFC